ncbi:unnamed protein product [Rotaria magnacalcarata]|uniref:Proactivator polypeptide n=2 Tax=Rotaria magnacalcarata TaxID=392030 RepID=A0A814JZY6_9BILA|nr:unnamed protein product [Rotaria magnacalcarata]
MKLITILSAIVVITTSTWAYSDECIKGPEYWCRDATTAEKCGAVDHCQRTVWNQKEADKKAITGSQTAEMLCNVLVQAANELISDTFINVNSMKQYLRQECTKLPSQNNLIQKCETAVDLYLPDILRHIQSGTEITKICRIIQGHDSQSAFVAKPKPTGITPNQTCVLCEFVMHILQTFATANSSAQELAQILEDVCQAMPAALKDECKAFIEQYGIDLIVLLLRDFDPDKACQLVKLCPKPKDVAFLTKPNQSACGLCDYVSTYLSAGYPIENVCTHFSTDKNIKQQCEILAHIYKPNFCSQLPVCKEDVVIQPVEQSIQTTIQSTECSLCKFVISYIDTIIQNNRSEAAILAALEKVCTILPAALKTKCDQFVDTYGPILVQLLEKYSTPEDVCDALKLCKNGTVEIIPSYLKIVKFEKVTANPVECALCKYIISYVDAVIQNNKSEAAIVAALEKVCTILPSSLHDKCKQFIDTYSTALVQLIEKYGTPEKVCDALKLCTNGTEEIIPIKFEKVTANPVECALCKYIISYVDAVIQNNKSEAAIVAALEKVCTILPSSLHDKCKQFIDTYSTALVQLIEKYGTPEQVCDALKLCTNGTEASSLLERVQQMESKQVSLNGLQCTFCKLIIGYLESAVQNNRTPAAIEAALEKVCNYLPATLKDNCTHFVKIYGPIIAILLEKNATAVQVCNFIKLCNNGTQDITSSVPDQGFNIEKLSIKSVECALCKYIIGYVDTVIQNNKSEAAIEAALEKVCTILPSSIKPKCDQFVVTYGPVLLQLIKTYGTPDLVCDALKLCNNGTQQISRRALLQVLKLQRVVGSPATCALCKYVVGYIDIIIQNNKSEAAIEAALEKVCAILPAAIKAACDQFVVTYGPALFQLIQKYGTPDKVCGALKLCNNGTQEIIPVESFKVERVPGSPATCALCKYVVGYVDIIIQNNKSEAAIEAALEKVCGILPAAIKAACDQFVVTYGPALFQLIQKYGTPDKVCGALKLCNNGTQEIIPVEGSIVERVPGSPATCALCKYVVGYVDIIIQNNKSEAAIEAALEKVCGILPAAIKAACDQFVVTYGPALFQLIQKYGTPDKVCGALKLCNNGTQTMESIDLIDTVPSKPIKDDPECSLCKYVVSYLDLLIQSNITAAELEKALEFVCTILPSSYQKQCKTFVDSYAPILAELIAELDDPNVVCVWLTLCPKSEDKVIQVPALKMNKFKSLPCNLCEYIVNYLEAIIQSNSTETQFEDALDKACKIIPISQLQSECQTLVHLYGDDLINYLVNHGNPKAVCQKLGICDK